MNNLLTFISVKEIFKFWMKFSWLLSLNVFSNFYYLFWAILLIYCHNNHLIFGFCLKVYSANEFECLFLFLLSFQGKPSSLLS